MSKHSGHRRPTKQEGGTTSKKSPRWLPFGVVIALLGGAGLIGLSFATTAVATTVAADSVDVSTTWTGNGNENANPGCTDGQTANWHWIWTPGGNFDLLTGTLSVTYASGATTTTEGTPSSQGGNGAMQFNVSLLANDTVTAATVSGTATGEGNNVLTISDSSCSGGSTSSTPPPPTDVTPAQPTHTTPDCTSQTETVTPSDQEGVVWNPSGSTTLKPGESVTYTATPAEGFEFPEGAQTSWTFTNNLDVSKCSTSTPPPPPPSKSGSVSVNCTSGVYTAKVDLQQTVVPHAPAVLTVTAGGKTFTDGQVANGNGDWSDTFTFTPPVGTTKVELKVTPPVSSGQDTYFDQTFTVNACSSPSPSHSILPPTQVGPVPHTGFTGTFTTVITHPYGWAKIPGIVLFGFGLLFGFAGLLKRREALRT